MRVQVTQGHARGTESAASVSPRTNQRRRSASLGLLHRNGGTCCSHECSSASMKRKSYL